MIESISLHWLAISCLFLTRTALGYNYFGDTESWRRFGRNRLEKTEANSQVRYEGKAKNVILFIGDGMDIATQTLAGHLKTDIAQHRIQKSLKFESFPHNGLSRTYSVNFFIPDSAATASSINTGVKTRNLVIGYDGTVETGNCKSALAARPLKSIYKLAKEAGRSVAVVTTDAVIGATPQATYSSTAQRGWSTPEKMKDQAGKGCVDTATQMVEKAGDFDVILGGGTDFFHTETNTGIKGIRTDEDLVAKWKNYQSSKDRKFSYVKSKRELDTVNPLQTDYLFGLFDKSKLPYQIDMDNNPQLRAKVPNLTEMVDKAFRIVSRNPKGFFMMIEGANIDKANHQSKSLVAATEVLELNRAISYVQGKTNPEETLIIVTSDHGHATNFGNDVMRNQNVFDFVLDSKGQKKRANDGKIYSSISYGSGPIKRTDTKTLVDSEIEGIKYQYMSWFYRSGAWHDGAYVPIYGSGAWSHLITTVHEQNYLYFVMEYAACLGESANREGCA